MSTGERARGLEGGRTRRGEKSEAEQIDHICLGDALGAGLRAVGCVRSRRLRGQKRTEEDLLKAKEGCLIRQRNKFGKGLTEGWKKAGKADLGISAARPGPGQTGWG
eukprot:936479-Pleurochrysis_carterae.AAC.1